MERQKEWGERKKVERKGRKEEKKKLTIKINSEKIVAVCQRLIVGSVPQDPRTHTHTQKTSRDPNRCSRHCPQLRLRVPHRPLGRWAGGRAELGGV